MIHFAPGVLAEFAASVQRVFGGREVCVQFDERDCCLSVTYTRNDDSLKIADRRVEHRQFDLAEIVPACSTVHSIQFHSSGESPLAIEYDE